PLSAHHVRSGGHGAPDGDDPDRSGRRHRPGGRSPGAGAGERPPTGAGAAAGGGESHVARGEPGAARDDERLRVARTASLQQSTDTAAATERVAVLNEELQASNEE